MHGVEQSGTRAVPRADLGAAFLEFMFQKNDLIALQALPIQKVGEKKAAFSAITRECLTRDVDTKRGPGGKYNREGIITEDIQYACEEHGLEGPLDDSKRREYASDFDAELAITLAIGNLLLIQQEKRAATALFDTAVFTGSALYTDYSGAPWDAAASDVIGQIKTVREKVRQNTGLEPNALIMSKTNMDRLLLNTGIKAAISGIRALTEAELIAALGPILGISKIIVGKGIRNTANKNKAFSGADIWSDDYAMVAVVANGSQEQTGMIEPCIGKTMLWVTDSPENVLSEQYRGEDVRSDIFRVRHHVDEKIIDPYFGHLIKVDA